MFVYSCVPWMMHLWSIAFITQKLYLKCTPIMYEKNNQYISCHIKLNKSFLFWSLNRILYTLSDQSSSFSRTLLKTTLPQETKLQGSPSAPRRSWINLQNHPTRSSYIKSHASEPLNTFGIKSYIKGHGIRQLGSFISQFYPCCMNWLSCLVGGFYALQFRI